MDREEEMGREEETGREEEMARSGLSAESWQQKLLCPGVAVRVQGW
jgi:hypothetical protein